MEITHKSALFVLRRIRHGLKDDRTEKLSGTVEVDETFHGPRKPRYKGTSKRGRGTSKVPILAAVERGGNVRFQVMDRLTAKDLNKMMVESADLSCRIISDEYAPYKIAASKFRGGHEHVNHSRKEYVRKGTDIHSNTVESVFSLFKRGVVGTFHSISKKHLPNYLNEFEFRWDTRNMDDGLRVSTAIRRVDGKRLKYRESVDDPP